MSQRTILIVDDHPSNRELLGLFLTNVGYDVITAENGSEGLRVARERRPDLILMDIAMPVIDGIEATELLKVDADTASIPVIAVTAQDDVATRARARAVDFEAILTKPVRPRRILQVIETCLHGPAPDDALLATAPINRPS